jgi:hypothetical protein
MTYRRRSGLAIAAEGLTVVLAACSGAGAAVPSSGPLTDVTVAAVPSADSAGLFSVGPMLAGP